MKLTITVRQKNCKLKLVCSVFRTRALSESSTLTWMDVWPKTYFR